MSEDKKPLKTARSKAEIIRTIVGVANLLVSVIAVIILLTR